MLVDVAEATAEAFDFAPNPTNGTLRLSGVTQAQDIVVLDLIGREVFRSAVDAGQQTLRLDIPEGVYLLGTSDMRNLRKLVVRR